MLPNWLYGKSKSKLAELLGGGGTPSDYNQVKAQVEQNTEDIVQLTQDSVTWDNLSEVGAVNDLSQPWATSAGTINGVTFSVNADGSISTSGTATADTSFYLRVSANPYHANNTKKFTCNPSGGSINTYYTRVFDKTLNMNIANDVGDGGVILESGHDFTFIITIRNGYTINQTFYPMIALPSYNGGYVPPAKTNKELTDELTIGAVSATANTDYLNGTNNAIFRKYGKMVSCEGYFQVTTAAARAAVLYTLAELPLGSSYLLALKNTGDHIMLNVKSDGTIIVESEGGIAAGFYSLIGTFVLS